MWYINPLWQHLQPINVTFKQLRTLHDKARSLFPIDQYMDVHEDMTLGMQRNGFLIYPTFEHNLFWGSFAGYVVIDHRMEGRLEIIDIVLDPDLPEGRKQAHRRKLVQKALALFRDAKWVDAIQVHVDGTEWVPPSLLLDLGFKERTWKRTSASIGSAREGTQYIIIKTGRTLKPLPDSGDTDGGNRPRPPPDNRPGSGGGIRCPTFLFLAS